MEITGVQIAAVVVTVASTLLLAWGVTMLDGKIGRGEDGSPDAPVKSAPESSGARPSKEKKTSNGSAKRRSKTR